MARTIDDGFETLYGAGQQYAASAAPYQPAPFPEERISDGLGHWWDSASQSWQNDSGGAYQAQPQDDYFGNFDSYAPENLGTTQYEPPVDVPFAPESWSLPPEEPTDYNLNAPVSAFTGYGSPNAANPWDANNQVEQDAPWWQDAGNAIGDSFVNTAQTFGNVIAAPYVAAESAFSDKTDTGFNERVGANFSGETFQDTLGIDTSYMDWLREQGILGKTAAYGIDTLTAPATILTAGLGPSAGAIGSAFKGPIAKRILGETALGTAAYLGGDAATSDVADKIPYFSDQPDWLRELEGGAIGGIGAYGGLKGLGKTSIDDAAIPQILRGGEEGSIDLGNVAKVLPGGFNIEPGVAEAGVRAGDLLKPRGIEQLGDYTVDDALKVARDLDRQRGSVANTLMAESDQAWRALGKTVTDENGNVFFKNIPPSAAEEAVGIRGALATRVIERPGEYVLTPQQAKAVDIIGSIEKRVANERDIFGVPVDRMALDEGEQYMHRLATKPSTATQVDMLVNQGAKSGDLTGGGIGRKLGSPSDKSRIFDDPLEAIQNGVVYAEPKEALRQSIDAGLKKAADAHVKGLLSPFAETASDRIPQALRDEVTAAKGIVERLNGRLATAEKRAGISMGQGDTAAKIFEAQATGAKLAMDAPTQDIQTINQFIKRAQARITALRQKGGVYTDQARVLSDMLDDARLRVADVMPDWEKAKDLARAVPPGRAAVGESAPALIGSDFTKRDAAIIKSALTGSPRIGDKVLPTNIPGIKVMNGVLVPLNAIGDASATANQLAMVGATHRVDFVKNFGKVLKDSFDDKGYLAWEASEKVKDAAKHGVHIAGDSGTRQDFQFGKWIEKIPVLKQTQKHFTRFGNRMRVDAYESIIDTAQKSGKPVDDLFKEQTGRAVNRVTGISNSRATDVEGVVSFAPNWLRSNLEQVGYAASDGTLEGQLARQYVKNYVTIGTMLVAGVAMATNRDLAEVLTPLDKKALQRGEIKLNPNFMTVRVGGQDINVFGSYDSLARLATIGVDSVYRSVNEKDANQLFDFLGYAGATKGSPAVKFLTDLIKGETFTGDDPLSLSSTAKRALPFTATGIMDGIQQGKDKGDIAKDATLGFFGVKSNPESPTEKASDFVKGMTYTDYNGNTVTAKTWSEIPKGDQARLLKEMPANLAKQLNDPWSQEEKDSQKALADQIAFQLDSDEKRKNGEITPEQWRKDYTDRKAELGIRNDQIYAKLDLTTSDKALAAYYAAIDAAKGSDGKIDWDKVDEYKSSLTKPQQDYLDRNTGLVKIDTPKTQQFKQEYDAIKESGYFERSDENWKDVASLVPTWDKLGTPVNPSDYEDYYDWRQAALKAGLDLAGKTFEDIATVTQIESWLDKQEPAKGMTYYGNQWKDEWVASNPEAAYRAWQYGYYSPKKEIKAWLAGQFE